MRMFFPVRSRYGFFSICVSTIFEVIDFRDVFSSVNQPDCLIERNCISDL